MPATTSDTSATTTVQPGEHDRRARRAHRPGDRLVQLEPVRELRPVAGDQEQRVVDADREPDHRRHGVGDVGHRDQVPHQADQAERRGQADHGAADRHAHRHHRAERQRQDQHRGEDADQVAGRGVVGGEGGADRAAALDLHPGLHPGLGGVHHPLRLFLGELVRADAEQHRDERDLAVLRDLPLPVLAERADRAVDEADLLDRLVRVGDRLLVGGVGHLALGDLEDDRVRPVLLRREAGLEEVGGQLAAGAGQVDVVARLRSDLLDDQRDAGRRGDPDQEHDHRMGGDQPSQAVQQPCHKCDDISGRAYDAGRGHRSGDPAHTAVPRRRVRLQAPRRAALPGAERLPRWASGRPSCWSATRRWTTPPSGASPTSWPSSPPSTSSRRWSTTRSRSAGSPRPTRSPTSTRWARHRRSPSTWWRSPRRCPWRSWARSCAAAATWRPPQASPSPAATRSTMPSPSTAWR